MRRLFEKIFVIAFAVLGAYYVFLGTGTLARLMEVTDRWIYLSGDSDFRLDRPQFAFMIAIGACGVAVFGAATVHASWRWWRGQATPRRWLVLTVIAPLLHAPWFMYRIIATWRLPRFLAADALRIVGFRFVVICACYFLAWAFIEIWRTDYENTRRVH
jgi:hypothetical protein